MLKVQHSWNLIIYGVIAFSSNCAFAQITPDKSLPKNSIVTSEDNTKIITGGTVNGSNLFHSFEQFSVPTGNTALFNNTPSIENIITRVTGSSASRIDGSLQANGTANLFVLNPNGIIFGPNASLKIGGSVLVSTASSLNFADSTKFSATAPQNTPILTISVPTGLQFGETVQSIVNQSQASLDGAVNSNYNPAGLQVQTGKTLALVGGDVLLEGGNITAAGGRIELGSVAANSVVNLIPTEKGWSLNYSGVQNFQNIQITQRTKVDGSEIQSFLDTTGENGNAQVQGRRVVLTGGSQIVAATLGSEPGGNVAVTASESVELIGTSPNGIFSGLLATTTSAGEAGNITIKTGRLLIQDGAAVSTESIESCSFGECVPATAGGGNLTVVASDSVKLTGSSTYNQPSGLFASTVGAEAAGNIVIDTDNLTVQNEAQVAVSSDGTGNAGNLEITASSIQLDNAGKLTATSSGEGGGNIALQNLDLLLLRGNSEIATDATGGSGDGGNINIETNLLIGLENSDITATAIAGRGGNIQINTQGIFGIEPRSDRTPLSDITASSRLGVDGVVEINRPDVDPSTEIAILPAEIIDVSGLIAQGCSAGGEAITRELSEFIITGRGGLPPTPTEALRGDTALVDLGESSISSANRAKPATVASNTTATAPLIEAQGWMTSSQGEVVLTAQTPGVISNVPWLKSASCES